MGDHGGSTPIISWGSQLKGVKVDAQKPQKREFTRYASFFLKGVEYRPRDTVYLNASDGPPYIATILGLLEDKKTSEKCMRVRWFARPCELPEGLADVDYRDENKEVFMQWGIAANGLVDPASTIRKCSVLCIAQEKWNTARPTLQQIASSDHVFKRAYDATRRKVETLEVFIQRFGVEYVTLVGKPIVLAPRTETTKENENQSGANSGIFDSGATGRGDMGTANPFWARGDRSGVSCRYAGSQHASQLPFPEVDLKSGRDSTGLHDGYIGSQHASQMPVLKSEFHNSQRDGRGAHGAEKGECSRPLRRRSTSVIRHSYTHKMRPGIR